MAKNFGSIAFTPKVQEEQRRHGSWASYRRMTNEGPATDRFGPYEQEFIGQRDGFYMASVSETGWPYVQYRGGPPGFLRVLDDHTLGFADFRGNRQYISVGNLNHDNRVALFLMDYPSQTRLKILGRVEIKEGPEAAGLIEQLQPSDYPAKTERAVLIHLEAFDWNCQQHITPRYSAPEIERAVAPLHDRIQALEAENAELRARLRQEP